MHQILDHISETEIDKVVHAILSVKPMPDTILLYGEVGAGKTTLVKKLIAALNCNDPGNSPTFSLINEYSDNQGNIIYHSDWYRIENVSELYDSGIDEYIYSGNLMIIEWPEIGMELLSGKQVLAVSVEHQKGFRNYQIQTTVV